MTTLIPLPPYTSSEIDALYPSALKLVQVQILLRHGERTPVSPRFQNAGLEPHWPLCDSARRLRSVILATSKEASSWSDLVWRRHLEQFNGESRSLRRSIAGQAEGICQPGELTDRGRETTLELGQRLRKLYVERLNFLPNDLLSTGTDIDSILLLRSTPVPRALESVQQAFFGLYPSSTRSPASIPAVVTRSMQEETLFPNEGACPRFAELSAAFAERAASLWNSSPEMDYINAKIGKWMPKGKDGVQTRIAVDSHPRLSGIMDSTNATLAHEKSVVGQHGVSLKKEFYDEDVRKNIDRIVTEEWFQGYQELNEYRKLGIGAAVGDVVENMVERVTKPNFKISMAGCHDTTLASFLASFGAYEVGKDKWPNFTSSIAFELFQDERTPELSASRPSWWSALFAAASSTNANQRAPISEMSSTQRSSLDGHYVRLRYNDRPLTLPYCAAKSGRHLSISEDSSVEGKQFCTLAAFKEAADSFAPRDWRSECKMNLGKPAVSAIPEPPPGVVLVGGVANSQ